MMPLQKPGKSKQDYGTPREFISAVEGRFGGLATDLACTLENCKAPEGLYFPAHDSLSESWAERFPRGNLWLNPPFANIGDWAAKCAREYDMRDGLILMLTPASIGTNWFAEHVQPNARVFGLAPRMTFEGTPPNPRTGRVDPFPKDLMLSVFGLEPGLECWRWK